MCSSSPARLLKAYNKVLRKSEYGHYELSAGGCCPRALRLTIVKVRQCACRSPNGWVLISIWCADYFDFCVFRIYELG